MSTRRAIWSLRRAIWSLRRAVWRPAMGLLLIWATAGAVLAGPLHEEVDRLVAARAGDVPLAPPCDDATFLRRVYLDFAGRIPRADETRRFLTEPDPDKRPKLIDELLSRPDYARRMEEAFHVMLMERRGDDPEWTKFLQTSFAANQPWDQMVREILQPIEDDETKRGAAYFHTRRLTKEGEQPTDYPGLTRDIGRLFLGVDLQCAQCHDHLTIDDYKQVDFQGLYVVFSNTSIKGSVKYPALAEKPATAKLEFVSVFEDVKKSVGPRVPFGQEFPPPVAPAEKNQPIASSLALLAGSLTAADNRLFAQNAVNRLWFLLMGRGLVHPLDLNHRDNPPSHPELLDLLAKEFAAHQFDVKWLLRELALTQTYARSSVLSNDRPPPGPELFAVALERRVSAEQLLRSLLIALPLTDESRDELKLTERFTALRPKALKAFANPAKDPEDGYNVTVAGALSLLNDAAFLQLFEAEPGNLTARAAGLSDPQAVEELYVALLARLPSDEERAEGVAFLERFSGERRPQGVKLMAWALAASMEFSVVH